MLHEQRGSLLCTDVEGRWGWQGGWCTKISDGVGFGRAELDTGLAFAFSFHHEVTQHYLFNERPTVLAATKKAQARMNCTQVRHRADICDEGRHSAKDATSFYTLLLH